MQKRLFIIPLALLAIVGLTAAVDDAAADQYLVTGSNGPSFSSPEEAVIVLEGMIFPMFDALTAMEKEGKITGGLPIAGRAFAFILEAPTNEQADKMLRDLPAWPLFDWEVLALQSFSHRAEQERAHVKAMKAAKR